MPDISMCESTTCTLRKQCYRHEAIPNGQWQAYADFEQNEDGTCDWFWELEENPKDNRDDNPVSVL